MLIHPGTYDEDVVVRSDGVKLIGTCSDQVTIRGSGKRAPSDWPCGSDVPVAAICIASSAAAAAISRLAVTGDGDGIAIVGAEHVTLDDVSVVDCARPLTAQG